MVSFDVKSLFPSIPVPIALDHIKDHLVCNNVTPEIVNVYMKAIKLCMQQNYFQFRNQFYKINNGTSMGNPLSPLIAECFMSNFELTLKNDSNFPRIWLRYVDDIFAIIKKDKLDDTLNIINNQYIDINFTAEVELNRKLSFLDLELNIINNKIDISVYHKPTSTLRYITNDSHCPIQHKLAAFHSMIHRMCKLPLSISNYMKEHNYIKNAAIVNGYKLIDIERMITKHSRKIKNSRMSTLFTQKRQQDKNNTYKRHSIAFTPEITNNLKIPFKKHNMYMVFSNRGRLKDILGSTKDKSDHLEKSGIYEIDCGDCDMKYVGQTRRKLKTRFKEHMDAIKNNQTQKSSVAAHVLDNNHWNISQNNLKLLKEVNNTKKLDAYESYFIQRTTNPMNADNGNINSNLFKII